MFVPRLSVKYTLPLVLICFALMSVTAMAQSSRRNGKIAFVSDRDGDAEIYVMNSDGSGQVQLTHNNWHDSIPEWSPDGRRIAFLSYVGDFNPYSVFIMNADGSEWKEIWSVTSATRISWSPDGRRLAFDDDGKIFVINLDGSGGGRNISGNNQRSDLGPVFSPDGTKIMFSRYGNYPPGYGGTMLHIVNPDGTGLAPLLNGFADGWNEDSVDWSINNKIIYNVNLWDYGEDLFIANSDGTDRRNFYGGCSSAVPVPCSAGTSNPRFSPDGGKVIFVRTVGPPGRPQIHVQTIGVPGSTLLVDYAHSPNWQRQPMITVSGRVTTTTGAPLRNAVVTITDGVGVSRTTVTGPFGFYSFDSVISGEAYTLAASAKRFRFTARQIPLDDDATGVDIVANPSYGQRNFLQDGNKKRN